jgi:WD40 repeat protein
VRVNRDIFKVKETEMKAMFCTFFAAARAHDDTVSCLKFVGRNESRLMTASWDGSIKVWVDYNLYKVKEKEIKAMFCTSFAAARA